jgi:hypothetical protein
VNLYQVQTAMRLEIKTRGDRVLLEAGPVQLNMSEVEAVEAHIKLGNALAHIQRKPEKNDAIPHV